MSRTTTPSSRNSRPRSTRRRGGASQRRRTEHLRVTLAGDPALSELAAEFTRAEQERARERDQERARQRNREAEIARERSECAAREDQERLETQQRYQLRNKPRARQERRILELLRRGAGVTQILREIVASGDGIRGMRRRAEHVDEMLRAVAAGDSRTSRIRMSDRDVQRYRGFLHGLIAEMNAAPRPDLSGYPEWAPRARPAPSC